MHFDGIILGVLSFLLIGIFHPIVIKAEYYFTKNIWPLFFIVGVGAVSTSVFASNHTARNLLSIFGIICLWSIKELYEQEQRVKKGWFPDGRKRSKSKQQSALEQ